MSHEDQDGWGGRLQAEFTPGLVSVIIPTYNRAALLVEAMESLRQQTWRALEIVVVDDGSTDDTQSVLETMPALGPDRTLIKLKQANRGVSAARNNGTGASTGEFILYLDSDDILVPDAIEHYIEAIRGAGSDYCHASIDSMDEAGRSQPDGGIWHSHPPERGDFFHNMWLVHAACYRRATVLHAGRWNEAMDSGEDHEFLLRIKIVGRGVHLPRIQGYYRMHAADQLHRRHKHTQNHEPTLAVLGSFVRWLEARGPIPQSIRLQLADRYRFIAVRSGVAGDRRIKNQALDHMERWLRGSCSPHYLFLLLRWINFPGVYGGLANLKQRLKGK